MFVVGLIVGLHISPRAPAPRLCASEPNSKGMTNVALVELGTGCCHYNNATKAAIRAANAAVEWNSIKVRTIIPGSYDAMRLHVHIGVPNPEAVDVDAVAKCFPYGTLLPIVIEKGGLLGSTRAGLVEDEPVEAHMTIACCCVTVGWGVPVGSPTPVKKVDAVPRVDQPPSPAPEAKPSPGTGVYTDAAAPPPVTISASEAERRKQLGTTPTEAEMTPRAPEMLARAALSKERWRDRVLTPYEAFAVIGDEDDIEIYDVRTDEQAKAHEINGKKGQRVLGAISVPLDDLVSGAKELPPADTPIVLVCSHGPKSLVALDYLSEACPRAVCVEGGISAWDSAVLPVEDV